MRPSPVAPRPRPSRLTLPGNSGSHASATFVRSRSYHVRIIDLEAELPGARHHGRAEHLGIHTAHVFDQWN
jgi:hypothetical protein